MLALFHGHCYQQLLEPEYWEKILSFRELNKKGIAEFFQIQQDASIEMFDPLAGFVGSDLLAGAASIQLLNKEPGTLFLDFGTNTEIAFWDGQAVWVTAAAGGPAFEGCGMSYGSAAVPGAIFRVCCANDAGSSFKARTIEDSAAIGICGSGYVDIIALLLKLNLLDSIGRLIGQAAVNNEVAILDASSIKVTKRDIDTFQRAKAAVAAGIRVLLHRAGMSSTDIKGIYVAGNFGRFLDIPNAQQIGLLPNNSPDKVYLCGNAALQGAQDVMVHEAAKEMLAAIKNKAISVNLGFDAEFRVDFYG